MSLYIYIPGQSLSRIIFDLCGFSGAGLKITFGLRVMDSMTRLWCQKVGLSRLFCVILRHIFGPSKCDWQRAKSAIVRFLVAHYFSVQTKKNAAFGCPGIYINIISYIYRLYMSRGKYLVHHAIDRVFLPRSPVPWRFLGSHLIFDGRTCF